MLLASFVQQSQLRFAVDKISDSLGIDKSKFKVFEIDKSELLIVYNIPNYGNVEFNSVWKNTISLHCKKQQNVYFSINAMNELIRNLNGGKHSLDFKIDWDNYSNSLIILRSSKLNIIPMREIFI